MRYKKQITKKFICAIVMISLGVQAGTYGVYAETTSEKIEKAEELKKATEEQKELVEDKKESLEDQKKALESYLGELNEDLDDISANLDKLEQKINDKEVEIREAEEALEAAKNEEAKQYDFMKKRIKFIYEKGDTNYIEAFATAKSYTDFLNKAEYVEKTEAYDHKMFESMIALRKDVEAQEAALQEEMEELEELRAEAENEHNKVATLVSSTSGSIAATDGAISAAEIEAQAYEEELKNQEANLAALKKRLAEEKAMSAKAAQMSWRDVSEIPFEVSDRDMLAAIIYCEAGGEPYIGQVAVGAVVINRMRSAAYPNTMAGVLYQKGQFSPVGSGRFATRLAMGAPAQCYQAADEAMAGASPVGNCLYFRTVIPQINGQIIGGHVFY